jgi:hypothetical protein
MDNWMRAGTDIEEGQELELEIADGSIEESDLTATGQRCLKAYRDSLAAGLDFLGLSDDPKSS